MTSKEYKLQKDQHFTKNSETLQGKDLFCVIVFINWKAVEAVL